VDDAVDLVSIVEVAGIQADFVDAGLDGLHGTLEVEVDVGDDGDGDLGEDVLEGLGVFLLGDGDADDVGAGPGEGVDLGDSLVDFVGVGAGHRLDGDGGVAADGDGACVKLSCLATGSHDRASFPVAPDDCVRNRFARLVRDCLFVVVVALIDSDGVDKILGVIELRHVVSELHQRLGQFNVIINIHEAIHVRVHGFHIEVRETMFVFLIFIGVGHLHH